MLELSREKDLAAPPEGGKSGVLVWWIHDEKRRKKLCLSWPELLLIGVRVKWPEELATKSIEGWGEEGQHVAWVPAMARMLVRSNVPHPDVTALRDLRPGGFPRAAYRHNTPRLRNRKLAFLPFEVADGSFVYLINRSARRMTAAMGRTSPKELDLRLVDPPWAPGSLLLCAWRKGILRAAASCNLASEISE